MPRRIRHRLGQFLVALGGAALVAHVTLEARVFTSVEKVIGESFPGASVETVRFHLTRSEQTEMQKRTGSKDEGRLYTLYLARKNDRIAGLGLFDTRIVRTKDQTLFVALAADGKVARIEIVSFFEPEEYLAPARWLRLWNGRDDRRPNLPGKDLPGISGATMSAAAVSRSVRKTMYLFELYSAGRAVARH